MFHVNGIFFSFTLIVIKDKSSNYELQISASKNLLVLANFVVHQGLEFLFLMCTMALSCSANTYQQSAHVMNRYALLIPFLLSALVR